MNITLFGGSFDPIHNGHLAIAHYIVQQTNTDELWFLLSPQNPLKTDKKQTNDSVRLEMLQLAVNVNPKFKICDIELTLPKPNYTINTLNELTKRYPENKFSLLIGEDNLAVFHKWKEYNSIINNHKIYVYPRQNATARLQHPNIVFTEAPFFDISSTEIRQLIQNKMSIENKVPNSIASFIKQHQLYL